MSRQGEIFTAIQLAFIGKWVPGYRQAKVGLQGDTVCMFLQRLVLAYLDSFPFQTEDADLDRHTPRERLTRSARRELQLCEDLHAALDRAEDDLEGFPIRPAKKVRRESSPRPRPRPRQAMRSSATRSIPPRPPNDMSRDIPDRSFVPSESSSPPPEPENAKYRVPETCGKAPVGPLAPFTFEDWLRHVDDNWGQRPRTWQEMRERNMADEVAAAQRTFPGAR
ncbi:hypothetical protein EDD18DRAFT_1348526 [Armillaria luteobubalina]|uniref:Uncharacterized protein n=1 Tax=Armillaria luteobubalina TaxID=153913 RepID=A0AA39QDY5_9AGAR|nr:hypothetical protein EDD18DRAFT_1348526 [Armillaria luteobubalina]